MMPDYDEGSLPEEMEGEDREFAIRFYEAVLARDPGNTEILSVLGHLYTSAGLYEKGLAIDQRLVELKRDDPIAHYNLACSYSLLGQIDRSLAALARAIRLGYRDVDYMMRDPDLKNLSADPRFHELMSRIRQSYRSTGE